MSDPTPPTEESLPADRFQVLGDETRVRILRALAEHERDASGGGAHGEAILSFSALRKRSGVDGSSRFNYHLDRLVGTFLEVREDGYSLSPSGREVVAVLYRWADGSDPASAFKPVDIDGTCYECGRQCLRARYDPDSDELLIACAACGNCVAGARLPPGAFRDRTPEEVVALFARRSRAHMLLATDGTCPACLGRMTRGITAEVPDAWGFEALPYFACTRCRQRIWPTFGGYLLYHPDVRTFLIQRGVDPFATPFWDVEVCVTNHGTTIRSTDPWAVEVEFRVGGEVLTVALDGELAVTRTEIAIADR